MNKVVTINLNGNAYQLDEAGYDLLRDYLHEAGRRLASNPDREEILADIEQSIADKCRRRLAAHRSVTSTESVREFLEEMGPVQDLSADEGPSERQSPADDSAGVGLERPRRKLYRIKEGAMAGGVCEGLGAYFDLDVSLVRVVVVLLGLLSFGTVMLGYVMLWIILPSAKNAAEHAAARGLPSTAEGFVRRAREGYYGAAARTAAGMATRTAEEVVQRTRLGYSEVVSGGGSKWGHRLATFLRVVLAVAILAALAWLVLDALQAGSLGRWESAMMALIVLGIKVVPILLLAVCLFLLIRSRRRQ